MVIPINALMTIQVRVLSSQALAQLKGLEAQSRRTATGVGGIARQAQWGIPMLSKWGNQVQWAGRQLLYNFTLPIAIAMGAATKFALENEKAMVRVTKVYGDATPKFRRLAKTEIPALGEAFEALSNKFAVQQSQVISIAGDWAAAGASGLALAKSVDVTLQTMVLGELEAADATKQLIAIQAQYGQNTSQLIKTIEILNMVENQTGASMRDLMEGMARSAGVARTAGVDVEHLAAMIAALTPATGSAASAGNGLKTIISRILSPTREATQLMEEMGVAVTETAWQGMTATDRLHALAGAYDRMPNAASQLRRLSDAQAAHSATVFGSRWQINRFITLMRDITNENGYYQKALKSTTDEQKLFNQRQYELNRVLTSNPQMLKQTWVILQNAMAKVIVPLLPYIVYLAQQLAHLAQRFANLDPEIKKLILAGLVFLALVGPIARYVGSVSVLIGLLSAAFHFFAAKLVIVLLPLKLVGGLLLGLGGILLGIPKLIFGAAGALLKLGVVLIGAIIPVFASIAGMIGTAMAPFFGAMLAAIRGFAAPFRAVWFILLAQLRALWAATLLFMSLMMGPFKVAMMALWATTMVGINGVVVTLGTKLLVLWRLLHRTMVGLAAAGGRAIILVWAATMRGGALLIAGLGGILKGVALGFAALFKALPLLAAVGMRALAGVLLRAVPMIFAAMTGPWGIAIMVILGLVYAFRDQLVQAWDWIVKTFQAAAQAMPEAFQPVGDFFSDLAQHIIDAFWALPEGVRNAMIAVLTVVRDAAMAVYEWMSYLNPFARHSPSLVDQVKGGMDEIGKQYARAGTMGEGFKKAHKQMEGAIASQERVVDSWKYKLEDANWALSRQQDILDGLKDKLSEVQSVYDAHKSKLEAFADAPIQGMGKMNAKIFDNEMAQKNLRLEMLKFEKVNGSVDSVRDRLGALRGDIELTRGNANELRMAGAGSDVLGPINAQVAAMEAQANALAGAVSNSPVSKMQQQMEELERQGEILQLQNDIKYDPMINSIQQLADAQKELSYDQIVNGIERQRQAMNGLEPQINRLTNAVDNQQAIVDRHTAARDAIARKYDIEQRQLDLMRRRYDELTDAMNKNKDAAGALGSKGAKGAKDFVPVGLETFRAGKGADWADVGGQAKIGREGGMGDQSQMIKDFAEQTNSDLANIFGSFNMFAPLQRWWDRTWAWLKEHVGPVVKAIGDGLRGAMARLPDVWKALKDQFSKLKDSKFGQGAIDAFNIVADAVRTIWGWIKKVAKLFAPDVKRIFEAIKKAGKRAWKEIGPLLASFGELLEPAIKALGNLWQIIKPVIAILGGAFLGALKIVASVISHTLGPALDFVIDIVKSIIKIFRGVVKLIIGIFTADKQMLIDGVKDIFGGMLNMIWAIIKGFGKIVWGVIKGIVVGIWEWFQWLYDQLPDSVTDIVDAVVDKFKVLVKIVKWIWNKVLKPIYQSFKDTWNDLIKPYLQMWWTLLKKAWDKLKDAAKWVWDNVLKPVWNWFKKLWTDYVKPELSRWWDRIKDAWAVLKKVAVWLWDNVLKPIFNKAKELWTNYVKPELGKWWDRIKTAWDALKSAGSWIKEKVMDPIFEAFKTGWNKVKEWFRDNADTLLGPIKSVVNGIVKALNWIIKGINVLDNLPGVSIDIQQIPEPYAQGGIPRRKVGGGFKTNGARAIVGEGKPNWPEYVIPTDPTYRSRARALLGSAAVKLGVDLQGAWGETPKDLARVLRENPSGTVPQFGIGGWIADKGSDVWDTVVDLGKSAADLGKSAFANAFKPYIGLARKAADKVDWKPGKDAAHGGIDLAASWFGLANQTFQSEWEEAQNKFVGGKGAKNALNWARSQVGKPWVLGGVGPGSYDCSGFMSAITNVMLGRGPHMRLGSTASFPWSGFNTQGPFNPRGFIIGSNSSYAGGIGHMAGTLGGVNVESAGGVGVRVGSSARGAYDGGFNERGQLMLQYGGILRRRKGGIDAKLGEGRYDEAVVPLPRNWRTDAMQGRGAGGDTNIYINGTLEFPNIKTGNDAETFINNLKVLAKD